MRLGTEGTGDAPNLGELQVIAEMLALRETVPSQDAAVTPVRLDVQVPNWRGLSPSQVIAALRANQLEKKRDRDPEQPGVGEPETKLDRTDPDALQQIFGPNRPTVDRRIPNALKQLSAEQIGVQQRLAAHGPLLATLYGQQNFVPSKLKAMALFAEPTLLDLIAADQFLWLFVKPEPTIQAMLQVLTKANCTRLSQNWSLLFENRPKDACALANISFMKFPHVHTFVNACDIARLCSTHGSYVADLFEALQHDRLPVLLQHQPADVLDLCDTITICGTKNRLTEMRLTVFTALMGLSTHSLLTFAGFSQTVLKQFLKNSEARQLELLNDIEISAMGAIYQHETEAYTPQHPIGTGFQHSLEEHGAHLAEGDVHHKALASQNPKGQWQSATIHQGCMNWALANAKGSGQFFKAGGRWIPRAGIDAQALGLAPNHVGSVLNGNQWVHTRLFRVVLEVDENGGLHVVTAFPSLD